MIPLKDDIPSRTFPVVTVTLIAAISLTAKMGGASAQPYSNRPITLIVPFPPGGSATIIARSIAEKLGDALGQQIVVDNRAGAGGSIGARHAARSAPDGTIILLTFTGTLAANPLGGRLLFNGNLASEGGLTQTSLVSMT